jgi:hypothetical protein
MIFWNSMVNASKLPIIFQRKKQGLTDVPTVRLQPILIITPFLTLLLKRHDPSLTATML